MIDFFRILISAVQAYLSSFGNKTKVIEAVFDTAKEEVTAAFIGPLPRPSEDDQSDEPTQTPPRDVEGSPGPTVFVRDVDSVYGNNRKH
jgi:hypothetical protein